MKGFEGLTNRGLIWALVALGLLVIYAPPFYLIAIPPLLQNPKVLVGYDAEVV